MPGTWDWRHTPAATAISMMAIKVAENRVMSWSVNSFMGQMSLE